MSMPDSDSPEPDAGASTLPERPGGGRTFVALIPHAGVEPPTDLSDQDALAIWCAVSALWHPSLLARGAELPRIESVDSPSSPEPNEVRIVAGGAGERLPSGYRTHAADAGAILIDGGTDRDALVREIQERLGAVGTPETAEAPDMRSTALDFMALGTAQWWLKDLTVAMAHADGPDQENLTRETLAGALAWQNCDRPTATNRLRAAFEVLTQARERFYPVDSYLIDICLLDPAMPAGVLTDSLEARAAVSFLGPAKAIENLAERDPGSMASLREAITEGWADVVGGAYVESEEPLLPLESIVWQFRKGTEVYRTHLDDRNVETVARRRFGLYPQLPQLAKRLGFRFAIHLGFDAGRFPVRVEAKRLWESPDGTSMESLTRPPLAADKPAAGLSLPWRIAHTMKDDHVATIALVHWPKTVAPWYLDLRRVAAFSPVMTRWVTLNDYFHLTDRPFEYFRPEPDSYVTPYLTQAIARNDPRPISRLAEHTRLRARFDAFTTVRALATSLSTEATHVDEPSLAELEATIETGNFEAAAKGLDRLEPVWSGTLARSIVGGGTGGRPGYLVFNPVGVARRVSVVLPDAAPNLMPEGPLRAAQFTDEGVWAIVDLPAFGFAWVPRESSPGSTSPSAKTLSVRDRVMGNESLTVEIDQSTGGIRALQTTRESSARLGQQLVITGLSGSDGTPATSRMVSREIEVDYAGPALAQVVSRGSIVGPGDLRLASFQQRYRLWSGRTTLEIEITLSDLDPAWLEGLARSDPWTYSLACRWAWPDPASMLRRTSLLGPDVTEADRPETPDAIDISTRRQRTALLFGGLAHHQRHGKRMLDTILIAGRETARSFQLGVALDLEYPFHASFDLIAPAVVVPTEAGPPSAGPTGWLFQIDNKAVAVTRVEYVDSSGEGRGWGIAFHLVETGGQSARCRLRMFRNPSWARQTDFNSELIIDLPVDGDAVSIDLTPHEIARVDVTLG